VKGFVSILVFLDQALKVFALRRHIMAYRGFNPCFPGSSAERAMPAALDARHGLFQSLFSWIKR